MASTLGRRDHMGQMKTPDTAVTLSPPSKPTLPHPYLHCHHHGPGLGKTIGRCGVKANGERGAKEKAQGAEEEEEGGWDGCLEKPFVNSYLGS